MKNFVSPGLNLSLTAPANIYSGDVVQVGQLVVVATGNASSGKPFVGTRQGVFDIPKKPAEAVEEGDLLYWDDGNGYATKTAATGLVLFGAAVADAAGADTIVQALFTGQVAADEPAPPAPPPAG